MIHPRRLAWSGRVAARGLWLDLSLLGEEEARRRVLALWQPGCILCEADGGWWLTFEGLRSLAAPFPGTPLVPDDGVLLGTPRVLRPQVTGFSVPATSARARLLK